MINLLIKNKSPLNATDVAGYTALHHAVAEGHGKAQRILTENIDILTRPAVGDAAVALLKAGAETDKKDSDGMLALELAPDKEVRKYIERAAEMEGIDI
ncbi:hypothetical protein BR93DRAFT_929336, partial [Coniochaeta sp. PMI_546]